MESVSPVPSIRAPTSPVAAPPPPPPSSSRGPSSRARTGGTRSGTQSSGSGSRSGSFRSSSYLSSPRQREFSSSKRKSRHAGAASSRSGSGSGPKSGAATNGQEQAQAHQQQRRRRLFADVEFRWRWRSESVMYWPGTRSALANIIDRKRMATLLGRDSTLGIREIVCNIRKERGTVDFWSRCSACFVLPYLKPGPHPMSSVEFLKTIFVEQTYDNNPGPRLTFPFAATGQTTSSSAMDPYQTNERTRDDRDAETKAEIEPPVTYLRYDITRIVQ
ncbi:hypothetical protein F5B18DRAFT_650922 [Nemania serpens]|nr:hypothetical protein F5B18DRAFT_650922 [Nemania serpens]